MFPKTLTESIAHFSNVKSHCYCPVLCCCYGLGVVPKVCLSSTQVIFSEVDFSYSYDGLKERKGDPNINTKK